MKVRVSKNLKGSIIIPTLSTKAIIANDEFTVTSQQFWAEDIQQALNKKLLVTNVSNFRQENALLTIKNISKTVISLPGVGLLKIGAKAKISNEQLATEAFRKLLEKEMLSILTDEEVQKDSGKKKKGRKKGSTKEVLKAKKEIQSEETINEENRAIVMTNNNGEVSAKVVSSKKTKAKIADKKGVIIKDDSILIDPAAKDNDEDDEVNFVDHQQEKERIEKFNKKKK